MITRNENGKISINTLDLEIFVREQLAICKTEHEIEFVSEAITEMFEYVSEELIDELS